jgi:2,3-dihydroxybenzoate decarboxylase
MQGKIGLEEHFAIPDTLMDSAGFVPPDYWEILESRILDLHDERLRQMDAHGMEMMILSLNAPAVQAIPDTGRAVEVAKKANDRLAEAVAARPDRFQGFAALPVQDPDAAAEELTRCMRELGFRGALVNGFSNIDREGGVAYYDHPDYLGFWEQAQALDAPFYLHPRNPLPQDSRIYAGAEYLLGPTWAFGQETAVHALRLMGSGLFDRFPKLKIVVGHLGEGLPYSIWRVDNRNAWVKTPPKHAAKHPLGHYFSRNFWLTTSGNFRTPSLIDAMMELGSDRLLFSTDWPFEMVSDAARWFDACEISENDRLKIGRTNAIQLFKLG